HVPRPSNSRNFGLAWFFLCLAFAAHIADEALTGFLPVYNATVRAARAEISWFPMPTFEYREWLFGLIGAVVICLLLTPAGFAPWPGFLQASCFSTALPILSLRFLVVPFPPFTFPAPLPASTLRLSSSRPRSISLRGSCTHVA